MGKYKYGILGPFSGKIGTVIGSSWNGIDYMKRLPKPSSKPATNLQLLHRAKFGLATGFLGPLNRLLNVSFKTSAVQQTGANVAVAKTISDAITGTYPNLEIDYTKLTFSEGKLIGPWNPAAVSTSPSEIEFSWTLSGTAANSNDKTLIVIYNPGRSEFVHNMDNGAPRSALSDTIVVPENFSGDTVHCWITFMKPDKSLFATSIYAGQVIVD